MKTPEAILKIKADPTRLTKLGMIDRRKLTKLERKLIDDNCKRMQEFGYLAGLSAGREHFDDHAPTPQRERRKFYVDAHKLAFAIVLTGRGLTWDEGASALFAELKRGPHHDDNCEDVDWIHGFLFGVRLQWSRDDRK